MKRLISFVLCFIVLAANGFAVEENSLMNNLDARCLHVCRTSGDPITYRELLAEAKEVSADNKN